MINGKFSIFLSVNDMLGGEALALLADLSRIVAAKMDEPILHMWGWINSQIEIVVAISYSCMIHGDQPPSTLWYMDTNWDQESGLGLAH